MDLPPYRVPLKTLALTAVAAKIVSGPREPINPSYPCGLMGLCAHGVTRDRIQTILLHSRVVPAELMLKLGHEVIGGEAVVAVLLLRPAPLPLSCGILPVQRCSRPLIGLGCCAELFMHVLVVLVVVGGTDRCQ